MSFQTPIEITFVDVRVCGSECVTIYAFVAIVNTTETDCEKPMKKKGNVTVYF